MAVPQDIDAAYMAVDAFLAPFVDDTGCIDPERVPDIFQEMRGAENAMLRPFLAWEYMLAVTDVLGQLYDHMKCPNVVAFMATLANNALTMVVFRGMEDRNIYHLGHIMCVYDSPALLKLSQYLAKELDETDRLEPSSLMYKAVACNATKVIDELANQMHPGWTFDLMQLGASCEVDAYIFVASHACTPLTELWRVLDDLTTSCMYSLWKLICLAELHRRRAPYTSKISFSEKQIEMMVQTLIHYMDKYPISMAAAIHGLAGVYAAWTPDFGAMLLAGVAENFTTAIATLEILRAFQSEGIRFSPMHKTRVSASTRLSVESADSLPALTLTITRSTRLSSPISAALNLWAVNSTSPRAACPRITLLMELGCGWTAADRALAQRSGYPAIPHEEEEASKKRKTST